MSNNLLAPESPPYQALVVTAQENVTLEAVSKLQEFVDTGLPIIISGGLPDYYASGNRSQLNSVQEALQTPQGSQNVRTCENGQNAAKLNELDIRPRVEEIGRAYV